MADTETGMGTGAGVAAGVDGGGVALPVGLQSFEIIRTEGYLYVDKTAYIWRLVNGADRSRVCFLSRPRRFGKSLLTSTLEAYFQGRRDLFHGLAIESLEAAKGEEAWAEYPVVRFDLSAGGYTERNGLKDKLEDSLRQTMFHYDLDRVDGETLSTRFANLIRTLHQRTGRRVVILVDEYDSPLLDITDTHPEWLAESRQLYKEFFSAVKSENDHIRFAFFTGVTKFTGVTVFSGLNNLKDITLSEDYAGMCGITEGELRENLLPWVDRMAAKNRLDRQECLERLRLMYDGYRFAADMERVYNPFSLLSALDAGRFRRYWFASGTPSFLIPRLKTTGLTAEQIVDGELSMTSDDLMDYRDDNPSPIPLLYQAGYLTIDEYNPDTDKYTLRFPNREVKTGFFDQLGKSMFGARDFAARRSLDAMARAVRNGDTDGFMTRMRALLASVAYPEALEREYQWRDQMYIILTLLGFDVTCEAHFSHGRSDCVIQTDRHVYVVEFKLDKSAAEALAQIDENGYATPFEADTRTVHKLGVSFSTSERTISEWTEA